MSIGALAICIFDAFLWLHNLKLIVGML